MNDDDVILFILPFPNEDCLLKIMRKDQKVGKKACIPFFQKWMNYAFVSEYCSLKQY